MNPPCPHYEPFRKMYEKDGPPPNLDRCPWCGATWKD